MKRNACRNDTIKRKAHKDKTNESVNSEAVGINKNTDKEETMCDISLRMIKEGLHYLWEHLAYALRR